MLWFGLPATISLLAGAAWGLWVVHIFLTRHTLLVGSTIISVLLTILGTLALFAGVILHSLREILTLWTQPAENAAHRTPVLGKVLQTGDRRQPLIFYSGPGTVLLLAGVAWGMRVMYILRQTQAVAVGSALICMLLCIVGSLGILAGIILYSVRGILRDLTRTKRGT